MEIVKDWTTLELIEYLNSFRKISNEDKKNNIEAFKAVREELTERQPIIGWSYTL